MSLERSSLYLVAPAELKAGRLSEIVPLLVAAGVDVVQLREKDMSDADIKRVAPPVALACKEAGVPFILNDRPDLARDVAADGVHVGQDDEPVPAARRTAGGIVGMSTHSRDQIVASEPLRPDYIAVGPVYETPTKPGRPSVGLELLSFAAQHASVPWFAIGGIDIDNIGDVVRAGATRVVVVRAITEAADPIAATAALKAALPG
ncbi:MAG: thiamine-phosphate pyrophosphorylase [Actinomycetota bacterium]|nr:thiamine-phosphate pyrophosphorylase [Actinomycetota bacterium]